MCSRALPAQSPLAPSVQLLDTSPLQAYHRPVESKERYWLIAVVCGIVIVAAVLRLTDLDLIELKGDEAVAIHMALPMVEGQGIPKVGLVNSVGLRNPPLFIYLVALPTWMSVEPRFVTAGLIGLTSTLAVLFTFLVIRPRFGNFIGVMASLFYAIAPWPILYGRKLWAQDVLPLFSLALLWCFFTVHEKPKTRWVAAIPIVLCALWQLHLSAVGLILMAGIYLLTYRRRIHWGALVAGTVLATMMLTPYVLHQVDNDWQDVRGFQRMAQGKKPDGSPRDSEKKWSSDGVRWTAYISAGNDLEYACGSSHDAYQGSQSAVVRFIRNAGTVLGTLLLGFGFLLCCAFSLNRLSDGRVPWLQQLQSRVDPVYGSGTMVWWTLGYLLIFTALRLEKVFPHYYIILYPAQFVCMALPLEIFRSRGRLGQVTTYLVISVVVAGNMLTLSSFRQYLHDHGGTAGDYGVTYEHKDLLTQYVAASGLVLDGWRGWEYGHLVEMVRQYGDFDAASELVEVRGSPPPGRKKVRIYNTLRQPQYAKTKCLGRQDFGPLVLCPRR